jgi:hypothetical protein
MSYLSTLDLEGYINDIFEKLIDLSTKDDVYEPLTIHFATGTPHNEPGDYCYSDANGYHLCSIGDHGESYPEVVTKSLFEISYLILKHPVRLMSTKYKTRNKIVGQDFRRIMFQKELQYFNVLGDEYKQKAEKEINDILNEYPFEDDDTQSPNSYQVAGKKLTYTLETNGSYFEDKDISTVLMEDYLGHLTSAYWDFMTLRPSMPIKGSSFIQVGSPDVKTDYKMTMEIGFQNLGKVELFRYYTVDKGEVLSIFKNYYERQELPNFKNWNNVSNEINQTKQRRFL